MNLHSTVPALYRENVEAPDIVNRTTLNTSDTAETTGGELPADTYKVTLVPRGQMTNLVSYQGLSGRGLPVALTDVVTSGSNKAILITPSERGDYDVYVSTDVDPKWVCTVKDLEWSTTGVKTTEYGITTTAGAVAGKIKITVPGEGLDATTYAVESTEYVYPPTAGVNLDPVGTAGGVEINTSGFEYIDFLIHFRWFGETEVPELVVVPILKSEVPISGVGLVNRYYAETPYPIGVNGGREDEDFAPTFNRLRVATRGAQSVSLVVAKIKGNNASLDVHYLLN